MSCQLNSITKRLFPVSPDCSLSSWMIVDPAAAQMNFESLAHDNFCEMQPPLLLRRVCPHKNVQLKLDIPLKFPFINFSPTCWPYSLSLLSMVGYQLQRNKKTPSILRAFVYIPSATNPICITSSTYKSNFPAGLFKHLCPLCLNQLLLLIWKRLWHMLQGTYGLSVPFCCKTESEIPLHIGSRINCWYYSIWGYCWHWWGWAEVLYQRTWEAAEVGNMARDRNHSSGPWDQQSLGFVA